MKWKIGKCKKCGRNVKAPLNPLTNPNIVVCKCGNIVRTKIKEKK